MLLEGQTRAKQLRLILEASGTKHLDGEVVPSRAVALEGWVA